MDILLYITTFIYFFCIITFPTAYIIYSDFGGVEENPKLFKKYIKLRGRMLKIVRKRLTIDEIKEEIDKKKYRYHYIIVLDKDIEFDNYSGYVYPYTIVFKHEEDDEYCLNLYDIKGQKWLIVRSYNEQDAYNALRVCLRYTDIAMKWKMKTILRKVKAKKYAAEPYTKVGTCTDKVYGKSELTEEDFAPLFFDHRALCWYSERVRDDSPHGSIPLYKIKYFFYLNGSTRVYEFLNWAWKTQQEQHIIRELSPEEKKEARHIYNDIVKKLHPDLNRNISEKDKELFTNAVRAYKANDIDKLRSIMAEVEENIRQRFQMIVELIKHKGE